MIDKICKEAEQRMIKMIDVLQQEFIRLRTGRAHPSLLAHIKVDYYGSNVPLSQIANVGVQDTRTLTVMSFDRSAVPNIEKAIISAGLGLNPVTAGELIRVPLPSLNKERRQELVKIIKAEAEKVKVGIRNIRRDANQTFKNLLKDKGISADKNHDSSARIQQLTDEYINKADQLLAEKEKETMEV